jgi:hypothetical protein
MLVTRAVQCRRIVILSTAFILLCTGAAFSGEGGSSRVRSVRVAGSGTDLLNGAVVPSLFGNNRRV